MEEKTITLAQLCYMVDEWFDANETPIIKVVTSDLFEREGIVSFGRYIPEMLREARPSHFYINNTYEVRIDNIRMLEINNCRYFIEN